MEGITIRRLGPADVATFRALLRMFGTAFEDPESYCDAQPDDGYISTLLARGEFVALAALSDGAVVGALTAYELTKFERVRSEFYIYDLAVLEEHRRAGIATGLIEALKPIALARQAAVIFVQADRDDSPAIALYEKLGVREDVHHFDIAT